MARRRSAEDVLMRKLVGKGSRRGGTWFGRVGDLVTKPPVWAGVAATLATGGPRGRRAALRGSVCYAAAGLVHVLVKAIVGRSHPPGAGRRRIGPLTSSFPSGHAASDLGFALAASQELPLAFIPLSAATLAGHWSLVRKREHYLSDVLAGGALGMAVAAAAWKLWPPGGAAAQDDEDSVDASQRQGHGGPPAADRDPVAQVARRLRTSLSLK